MKYEAINWVKWMDTPDQEAYEAWLAVRKAKRSATTQYAIDLAGKHANKLIQMGYTATQVLDLAIERSWVGLQWVVDEQAKQGFPGGALPASVTPIRSTREVSTHEQLTDRSWAE